MFDCLCISGGGVKGFAQIGVLEYCYNKKLLDKISTFSGTSIGSVICTLLCCGFSPSEIYVLFTKVKFFPEPTDINIFTLFKEFGLINSDKYAEELRIILRKKYDKVPTMSELYNLTEKELYIAAVNVSKGGETVYFHHSTHPDLDIVDAVRMSCNLPFIFTRTEYEGDMYIDGGFTAHVPFSIIKSSLKTLAICTSGMASNLKQFGGFIEYLFSIIMIPIRELEKFQRNQAGWNCHFIDIVLEDEKILDTILDKSLQEKMWMIGYNQADKWFKENEINEWI